MPVLKSEQLHEDGQVRLKHVAIDCEFDVILNWGEIVNIFYVALKMEMNV